MNPTKSTSQRIPVAAEVTRRIYYPIRLLTSAATVQSVSASVRATLDTEWTIEEQSGGNRRNSWKFTPRHKFGILDLPMKPKRYRDPVVDAYMSGVDRTLLRENLKLSPAQRLEKLVSFSAFAATLRQAGQRARSGKGR